MQQLCSDMLQQWFFWVFWIIITLFYHQMSQIIIFGPFGPIINKKSNMLHFWPVCCRYAAGCSSGVFFFRGIWIILALPNYKMTYTMIFSPFDAIFDEKPNMLHFWLVCSNYAAICCQQWFFWVFWIVITFFYCEMTQIMIFSPINERSSMLHFWPVCCKYAAVCSSGGFFLGIWIIVTLPNYRMSQIIIFSLFDATFNEKSNMLHF